MRWWRRRTSTPSTWARPRPRRRRSSLRAIEAGKHVLVDKPLPDADAVRRMTDAAAAAGVLFMDATHFVHHPRTAAVREATPTRIGEPKSLHTTFYFPFDDRDNIRFDTDLEPMGAVGDMVWYSMRAVEEYLRPEGEAERVAVRVERDEVTGAVVRASGLIGFADGRSTTFDTGYTAGTAIMDLSLLGTSGMISMDDFALDWTDSFAFDHPGIPTGYVARAGMAARDGFEFVPTPADAPAQVRMIERFAETVRSGDPRAFERSAARSLRTQTLLDAVWRAANES